MNPIYARTWDVMLLGPLLWSSGFKSLHLCLCALSPGSPEEEKFFAEGAQSAYESFRDKAAFSRSMEVRGVAHGQGLGKQQHLEATMQFTSPGMLLESIQLISWYSKGPRARQPGWATGRVVKFVPFPVLPICVPC